MVGFSGVAHGLFILLLVASLFWTGALIGEMAEKWGQIMHILERENRKFEEAMKGQVGTISSSPNNSNKLGSLKMPTGTSIITQCTTEKRKNTKF